MNSKNISINTEKKSKYLNIQESQKNILEA
jgi:hypothetical protein